MNFYSIFWLTSTKYETCTQFSDEMDKNIANKMTFIGTTSLARYIDNRTRFIRTVCNMLCILDGCTLKFPFMYLINNFGRFWYQIALFTSYRNWLNIYSIHHNNNKIRWNFINKPKISSVITMMWYVVD